MNLTDVLLYLTEGAPVKLIAYHGSPVLFNKFDKSKINSGTGDGNMYGPGFYFASAPALAKAWNKHGYLYKCELAFSNPYYALSGEDRDKLAELMKSQMVNGKNTWDMTEFFKAGYDGVISKNEKWETGNKNRPNVKHNQYVVYEPSQIKILKVGKY